MFCPECGLKLTESGSFCSNCGARLPVPFLLPVEPAPMPSQSITADTSINPFRSHPQQSSAGYPSYPAPAPQPANYLNGYTPKLPPEDLFPNWKPEAPAGKRGSWWVPVLIMAVMVVVGLFMLFGGGEESRLQVSAKEPWFSVEDGTLYFDSSLYTGPEELTVPDSVNGIRVTALSQGCFQDCKELTTVILPEGLRDIGKDAFRRCDNIRGIYIPNSVKSIGDNAFYGCKNLEAICIPGGVNSIGENAFDGCGKLLYILYGGTGKEWKELYSKTVTPQTEIHASDGIIPQNDK